MDGQDAWLSVGGKPEGTVDFSYDSLFDDDNRSDDDLLADFTVAREATDISGALDYRLLPGQLGK